MPLFNTFRFRVDTREIQYGVAVSKSCNSIDSLNLVAQTTVKPDPLLEQYRDLSSAKRVRIELPLKSGKNTVIDIDLQDETIRKFMAQCPNFATLYSIGDGK
jgi:hypothetical protein